MLPKMLTLTSCARTFCPRATMSDDRDKAILADWSKHPGHTVMRQRLIEARTAYYTELGKTLYRSPDTLDPNDLKCKSAFFRGALWILNEPVFSRQALERELAKEVEEDE